MEAERDKYKGEANRLLHENQCLREQNAQLQEHISRMEKGVHVVSSVAASTEMAEAFRRDGAQEAFLDLYKSHTEDIGVLKAKMQTMATTHTTAIQSMREKHEAELNTLHNRIEELVKENGRLTGENVALLGQVGDLQKNHSLLQERHNDLADVVATLQAAEAQRR